MPDGDVPSKPVEVPAFRPTGLRDKITLLEQALVVASREGRDDEVLRIVDALEHTKQALAEAEGHSLTGDGTARP